MKVKEKEINESKAAQGSSNSEPSSSSASQPKKKDSKDIIETNIVTPVSSPAQKTRNEEDEWIAAGTKTTPNSKQIKLLDTEVIKTKPEELIWAPYYRFHFKLFCARLCENTEALLEPSIGWPIPDDKVVVEFFCQEKINNVARFLMVERNKIIPYWASKKQDKKSRYPEEEQTRWNQSRCDEMRNQLEKKYTSYDAKYVYNTIIRKADEFLR